MTNRRRWSCKPSRFGMRTSRIRQEASVARPEFSKSAPEKNASPRMPNERMSLQVELATQRSKVFGFLSDNIATTPFAGQIIQGAQEAAWQREMLLLTFNTAGDPAMEEAAVQTALERGVEG